MVGDCLSGNRQPGIAKTPPGEKRCRVGDELFRGHLPQVCLRLPAAMLFLVMPVSAQNGFIDSKRLRA